jgi:hypothetical protein
MNSVMALSIAHPAAGLKRPREAGTGDTTLGAGPAGQPVAS